MAKLVTISATANTSSAHRHTAMEWNKMNNEIRTASGKKPNDWTSIYAVVNTYDSDHIEFIGMYVDASRYMLSKFIDNAYRPMCMREVSVLVPAGVIGERPEIFLGDVVCTTPTSFMAGELKQIELVTVAKGV